MDIILHHYDASPYSEKMRAYLGFKRAAWRSVLVPPVAPKPDLTRLTGGYRRTPVLQIGADIYCDTSLMIERLEQVLPGPALATGPAAAAQALTGLWAEADFFWRAARLALAVKADELPDAFLADRGAMLGAVLDRTQMKAALPVLAGNVAALLPIIENGVAQAGDFLGGQGPSMADFQLYHTLWFLGGVDGLTRLGLKAGPLTAWLNRMTAFGHGDRQEIPAATAHDVAAAATPNDLPPHLDVPGTPALGLPMAVQPESFGKESSLGNLAALSATRIALDHQPDGLGPVRVHFPRLGYVFRLISRK